MRLSLQLLTSLLTYLLAGCGTIELTEQMLNAGIELTPEGIYEFEAEYYPNSTWSYLGERDGSHLFDRTGLSEDGTPVMSLSPWVLKDKHLDSIRGYPFDSDSDDSRPVDLEIHKEFIQIEVEGEEPVRIPFKSKGFITSDHRPRNGSEQADAGKPNPAAS